MGTQSQKTLLSADWRHLAILNFEIAPSILAPFVPSGTELDAWDGRTLVSVVGFLFLHTRLCGIPFPCHRNFEEVNLRFYVRRQAEDGWRRGVVFIKEIVPRPAIAVVARRLYHEPYVALPMAHRVEEIGTGGKFAEYSWRFAGRRHFLRVTAEEPPQPMQAGSEAEFITEHYWGYNMQPDGSTLEYEVTHPRWCVQAAVEAKLDCDVAALYGAQFRDSLSEAPVSAFLAEGSAVTVRKGVRLTR